MQITNYLKINGNKNITDQNLWDVDNEIFKRKCKFIRTERKLLKNKLNIQLKKHKNKINIKKTRRKELKKYKGRN